MNIFSFIIPILPVVGVDWVITCSTVKNMSYSARIKASSYFIKKSRVGTKDRKINFYVVFMMSKSGQIDFNKLVIPKTSTNNSVIMSESKEDLKPIIKEIRNNLK